ncbi:MAG: Holliday junction resolvase RuvX [Longimicrobiales bacterium]|nr:Holliday junction resolvase RuvX [Longimicrobiales bacterium]
MTRSRTLGIDYGERRIGMAVSDPTNTLATPLETLVRRAGKRPPIKKMAEVGARHDVGRVVVGLPLGLDGEENAWCAEVRAMGRKLAERLDVPVVFVDERMTSVRAERAVRSGGLPKSRREEKGRVDAAAAQLILQAWLDNPEIAR